MAMKSKGKDQFNFFLKKKIILMTNIKFKKVFEQGKRSLTLENVFAFKGILIDYNDDFFFLGDDEKEILQAVSRKSVISISIYTEDLEAELLGNISNKIGNEGLN